MIATILIKKAPKFFYVNFRPFPADSYGVEQNSSFLATCFSSACNFGRNANRPKILAGQISKYTRDHPKNFSCIWDKYWRIHMGSMEGKPGFPPSCKSQSRFRLSLRKVSRTKNVLTHKSSLKKNLLEVVNCEPKGSPFGEGFGYDPNFF